MVHDRVADRGHLDDAVACDAGGAGNLADQPVDRRTHGTRHLGVAAGMEHDIGDAAHQVLAEADLRVHRPRRGKRLAGDQIGEMRRDGGRTDIDCDAEHPVDQPGPDGDKVGAGADGGGDLPSAGAERLLEMRQHGQSGIDAGDLPLVAERRGEPAEVARRVVHVRLGNFHVVEAHHRIERDRPLVSLFAHDLAVDLALRRDVDDEVAEDVRLAAEAPAGLQRATDVDVALLGVVPLRQMVDRGHDAMLGERPCGDLDLATAADAASRRRPNRGRCRDCGQHRARWCPRRNGRVARTA